MLNTSLKNARILIIDDQESNIVLLESVLEREGFTDLKSTTDSRQVIALFDKFQPDLILLDLRMPHLDGFAVMEQLRMRIPVEDFLPILVLTADITPEVKLRSLAEGARDFLTKPFDVTEVSLRIRNLLETRYLHLQQKKQNQILEDKIYERTAELRQRADDLALINALNVAINQGYDLQKIFVLMSDELHRSFKCIGTITAFPNPDKKSMHIQHIEFPSPLAKQIENLVGASIWSIPLKIPMTGAGHFAQALRTGTPKAINDPDIIKALMAEFTENRLLKRLVSPVYETLGICSMLLIPLISESEIFGLLEMARTEPTSESDLSRIQGIAGQLTTAIGRKHSERLLRESEKKFKTLFNTANDAIFTMNHTTFLDCNIITEKIFRCSKEQIIGHSPVDFSPERQPDGSFSSQSALRKIEAAFAGQPQLFEWLHTHLDGTPFYAEVSLNRVFIDGELILQAIVRDIHERKLAEEALAEQSRFTSALLNTAPSLVYVYDMDTNSNVYINNGLDQILGYTVDQMKEMGAELFSLLIHPGDLPAVIAFQNKIAAAANQEVLEIDYRMGHRDGSWVNIRSYESPFLRNEDGTLKQKIGVGMDITERKRAEQNLRESTERLEEAQRIAKIGNWELNLINNILFWSDEIYHIFEIDPVKFDVSYEAFLAVIHPDDRDAVNKAYTSSLETRSSYDIDHRLLMLDGRVKYVHESCETIYAVDGQPIRSIGTVQDITERKQAERALTESEEKYRTLFQQASDGIMYLSIDRKILAVNHAFANVHGYNLNEMQDMNLQELDTPETALQAPDRVRRVLAGEIINFEVEHYHKNGHIIPLDVSTGLITIGGEQIIQSFHHDITERKQRENELQAIATLSAALRIAPTLAEMLPVIVDQLAALLNCQTVSVEIIDPLTGVIVTEAAHGIWESFIDTHQKNGSHNLTSISKKGQPFSNNDLLTDPKLAYSEWTYNDMLYCIGSPLIAQDRLIGFVWIGRRSEIAKPEVRLLSAVADIAANAIYRSTLYEKSLKDAADLSLAYDSTLEGWAHALELRDRETEGHARNVVQMTVDLALAMGVDEAELEHIRRGALLHDIGKMGIPDSILLKPGALDDREWEIMRQHPEYAYQLLEPIVYLHKALDIPYCHHEKWDGSGYPRGLKGEEIPLVARIFAIVDVYDALRSDRPYRKAWSKEQTYQHLHEQASKHFDPRVVAKFLAMLDNQSASIDR
ncbi:MAG: PAS domain S-box protein [Leptolinea sp.]